MRKRLFLVPILLLLGSALAGIFLIMQDTPERTETTSERFPSLESINSTFDGREWIVYQNFTGLLEKEDGDCDIAGAKGTPFDYATLTTTMTIEIPESGFIALKVRGDSGGHLTQWLDGCYPVNQSGEIKLTFELTYVFTGEINTLAFFLETDDSMVLMDMAFGATINSEILSMTILFDLVMWNGEGDE